MAKVGRIDAFDESLETWASYSERLDSWLKINKIENADKVSALLSVIGPKAYGLLRSLCAPEKPAAKQYADLIGYLGTHFAPKRLVIAERFRFHKREQKEGESVTEYVAELRKLSEHCQFGNFLKDSLRDRLVCGLRNKNIQEELLAKDDLNFDTAVQISVGMEAATRDAIEFQSKHQLSHEIGVHKVHKEKPKLKGSASSGKPCYRCSGTNHNPQECKFKNSKCHKCGKMGHIKRACLAHNQTSWKGVGARPKKGKIYAIEEDSDDEFLIANLQKQDSKKRIIWVTPTVDGQDLSMELDTGSAVSIINKSMYDKLFNGSH